jgi:uncharacterized membrane protein
MPHGSPNAFKPRIPLTVALGIASLGCLLMLGLRVLVTGSFSYAGLIWNLFLAWIPYLLSLAVRRISYRDGGCTGITPLAVLLGLAWLFFYPNAPYILTDIIHVIRGFPAEEIRPPLITENALLWYDIVLTSAFAFVGHIVGLISLLVMHRLIQESFDRFWGWAFALVAIGMGGYGIYIGRFERLNSWDIVRAPRLILRTTLLNLFNLKAVLFSLLFALFIFMTYLAVYTLFETARESGLPAGRHRDPRQGGPASA